MRKRIQAIVLISLNQEDQKFGFFTSWAVRLTRMKFQKKQNSKNQQHLFDNLKPNFRTRQEIDQNNFVLNNFRSIHVKKSINSVKCSGL